MKKNDASRKALRIIGSILVAIALWIYVDTVTSPEVTLKVKNVPVEFSGEDTTLADRGLMLLSGYDTTVDLVITTLSASELRLKLLNRRTLAHTVFRYYKKLLSLAFHLHANNLVILIKAHTDHAHGYTASGSYILFLKADAHSLLGYQENILLIVCSLYFNEFVSLFQYNSLKSVFAYIAVLYHRGFLYHTLFGCHKEILILIKLPHGNNGSNLFSRLKLQKVYNSGSSSSAACLRNLICL